MGVEAGSVGEATGWATHYEQERARSEIEPYIFMRQQIQRIVDSWLEGSVTPTAALFQIQTALILNRRLMGVEAGSDR